MERSGLSWTTEKSSEGVKRHREICHELLRIMEERSYFLKLSKCQFEQPKMDVLGWLVEDGNIKIDPAKVARIAEWPRELKNVKEVRSTLGVLGYQRPFIRGFAHIAKPLTELTKKTKPFEWTQECRNALDKLIKIITSEPVLACPDLDKPFELEVDASAYAVGAILFQRDESKQRRDVGYFSKALNPAEQNYDIWDREFLAVVTELRFWRHLLVGSSHKVTVWTDHANLQYYRHPQKVNRRVAQYIALLGDYNLELKHLPGIKNHADGLSRRPDYNQGGEDNDEVTALPDALFARVISDVAFDEQIRRQQKEHSEKIEEWKDKYQLRYSEGNWWKHTALVVTGGEHMWRTIAELYHGTPTTGHQGAFKTVGMAKRDYWWPTMWEYLKKYVQGCGICQKNKSNTHPNKPPLQPIMPETNAQPFQTIAMDNIVKLPLSKGYDSILTITDHNCTKAVILLPCKETIDAPGVAALFKERVFPFIGIPKKVITDRDTQFTSSFFKELCKQLGVEQAMSSAYYPQTDRQSERTNQSVKTTLRIFGNFRQSDWSEWLPLIQYQINSALSTTTKKAPYELWMGFVLHTYQPKRPSLLPEIDKQKEDLLCTRFQAQKTMRRARELHSKQTKWTPYVKGQKVWLEGTHLSTSHPFTKLHPKRFGPFQITETLGPVTYRLNLPEKWKIHNAFHATLLSPYVETEEYGVNFTELPPDLIRNKPKKESGGTSLWQQCHDKPREKERQPKISVLENIEQSCETQKELGNKKCIKDFHLSEAITSPAHSYMHGFLHTHRQ